MKLKKKIILGSASPRRRELLSGLDIDYSVRLVADIEENYPDELECERIPVYIAEQKSSAYHLSEDELLITADTIVCLDGKVYGKPHDDAEAYRMLSALSGRTHQVITGVCIRTNEKKVSFATTTDVTFATLSDIEIDYYIQKYHPTDKAGSYGIQEWIGYIGVERIDGSYFNVMGLPVQRLYSLLKNFVD